MAAARKHRTDIRARNAALTAATRWDAPAMLSSSLLPDSLPYPFSDFTSKYTSPSTAYAWPCSMILSIVATMSGTCCVARGSSCGLRQLRASMSW